MAYWTFLSVVFARFTALRSYSGSTVAELKLRLYVYAFCANIRTNPIASPWVRVCCVSTLVVTLRSWAKTQLAQWAISSDKDFPQSELIDLLRVCSCAVGFVFPTMRRREKSFPRKNSLTPHAVPSSPLLVSATICRRHCVNPTTGSLWCVFFLPLQHLFCCGGFGRFFIETV